VKEKNERLARELKEIKISLLRGVIGILESRSNTSEELGGRAEGADLQMEGGETLAVTRTGGTAVRSTAVRYTLHLQHL